MKSYELHSVRCEILSCNLRYVFIKCEPSENTAGGVQDFNVVVRPHSAWFDCTTIKWNKKAISWK